MGGMFAFAGIAVLMFVFLVSAFVTIPFVGGISGLQVVADNSTILYAMGIFLIIYGFSNSLLLSGTLSIIISLMLVFVLNWI